MHYEPVPKTVGYRASPTSRLRVLETASGEVAEEIKSGPVGTVSRLFCAGGKEGLVVSGDGKAHWSI